MPRLLLGASPWAQSRPLAMVRGMKGGSSWGKSVQHVKGRAWSGAARAAEPAREGTRSRASPIARAAVDLGSTNAPTAAAAAKWADCSQEWKAWTWRR